MDISDISSYTSCKNSTLRRKNSWVDANQINFANKNDIFAKKNEVKKKEIQVDNLAQIA